TDFLAWPDQQNRFDSAAAFSGDGSAFTFNDGGQAQRVRGSWVSRQFFDVLCVRPERGRTFLAEDDRQEAQRVVVVSRMFWQTQLHGDQGVLGSSITLNGQPFTVVGIMPAGVRFPSNQPIDVWPLKTFETPRGRPPYYRVGIGRLKSGVAPQQAVSELTSFASGVTRQFPNSSECVG